MNEKDTIDRIKTQLIQAVEVLKVPQTQDDLKAIGDILILFSQASSELSLIKKLSSVRITPAPSTQKRTMFSEFKKAS